MYSINKSIFTVGMPLHTNRTACRALNHVESPDIQIYKTQRLHPKPGLLQALLPLKKTHITDYNKWNHILFVRENNRTECYVNPEGNMFVSYRNL